MPDLGVRKSPASQGREGKDCHCKEQVKNSDYEVTKTMETMIERSPKTPINLALRLWLGIEVVFGILTILTLLFNPHNSATNFSWPIKPVVMAALFGAFYCAISVAIVNVFLARYWQEVRVIIIPAIVFTSLMLLTTLLHWEKFSLTRMSFYIWLISYISPPPIFALLYGWHQRQSTAVGQVLGSPLPTWARRFFRWHGLGLTGLACVFYLIPSLLAAIAPWPVTPLNARILSVFLGSVGLLQLSIWRENDWFHIKRVIPLFIVLPIVAVIQLLRFGSDVQWANLSLYLFLMDIGVIALLSLRLWQQK
jgi:hypothetical protein